MALIKNLLEYVEASAERRPEKTAFEDGTDFLSFSELLCLSRCLGTQIASKTGRTNAPVAVMTDRSVFPLVGFLAALQSGNFYVPIDAEMPEDRVEAIFSALRPAAVLYRSSQSEKAEKLCPNAPHILLDGESGEADLGLLAERRARVLDIDPAYVIYTSGSTGTPKGIVISHRSVIDFVEWMAEKCFISDSEVLGNQAPFYFDLSVKDIWLTLKCGLTTYILPKKLFLFPKLLISFLNEKKITTLIWATSAFNLAANSGVFGKYAPETVKKVILGGETLYAKQLNAWRAVLPDAVYINLYGPTEVTVDCTYYIIDREYENGESVPIGRACENMEVVLLDEALRPVQDGTPGEICVRGIGLARGYLSDPEKTAAAFVRDPRNPYYEDRLYRTGDIGVVNGDGLIVYISRRDGQIKHMGYRIELGEVEAAVNAVEGVTECAAFHDGEEDRIVLAYSGAPDGAEIIEAVKSRLPRYMYPNVFVKLDALPHNRNGKTDRPRLRQEYQDGKNN
ncbi:MAG: amino acid adenylation domain-containing protein [Oscillospiraceae bacterium]|nr:amino acid adenylation domain-containing protein [Oscillospiraceae bacterium]